MFSWILLRMRNVSDKGRKENHDTPYVQSPIAPPPPSSENLASIEIIWQKTTRCDAIMVTPMRHCVHYMYIALCCPFFVVFFSFISRMFCCNIPRWRWSVNTNETLEEVHNVTVTVDACIEWSDIVVWPCWGTAVLTPTFFNFVFFFFFAFVPCIVIQGGA